MGQAESHTSRFEAAAVDLERVRRGIGESAQAAAVFGQAVEQGGTVIVPVAKAVWGYGGSEDRLKQGSGAGVGAFVRPVGFIELKKGRISFRRIGVPWLIVGQAASAGALAALLLQRLRKGQER